MRVITTGIAVAVLMTVAVTSWAEDARYTVVKGDMLWRIAQQQYQNAGQWQALWEANKTLIPDPHKIYPGQELTIPDCTALSAAPAPAAPAMVPVPVPVSTPAPAPKAPVATVINENSDSADDESSDGNDIEEDDDTEAVTEDMPEETASLNELPGLSKPSPKEEIKEASFIAPLQWKPTGIITAERDRKMLISTGDTVYVSMENPWRAKGKQGMIYRKMKRMRDPRTNKYAGYEMKRVGKVAIADTSGDAIAIGVITMSYEPINANDVVVIDGE